MKYWMTIGLNVIYVHLIARLQREKQEFAGLRKILEGNFIFGNF